MNNFLNVIHVGFEVLAAVESVLAGGPGTVPFTWKGKQFTITVAPVAPGTPAA